MNWSVVGLAFDIVGAVALGSALFLNSPMRISHQAGTYWDSNPYAVKFFSGQTLDARFGLILLVLGFSFQALGQWWSDPPSILLGLVLIGLLAAVIGYLAMRRVLVGRLAAKVDQIDRS